MKDIAREIRAAVAQAAERLARMEPSQAAQRKNPREWSAKEILGHLIDSAANNHQRFVRACYQAADRFPPYRQTDWVRFQAYQEADWQELIVLWSAYNRHLCHVIDHVPAQALSAPCDIGEPETVPLEHVIVDYLRHLRHHLGDLLP